MRHPHTARLALAPLALLVLLLCAAPQAAFPGGAAATVTPIGEGSVTWGVKESWRNYVGSGTVSGGVTVNPDGTYEFPVVSGSHDDETGTTTLRLAGSVRWQSHKNPAGKYLLDTTFKDLSLEIGPTVQEIRGDNIGYSQDDPGGELYERIDVVLARIDIEGAATSFEAGSSEWSEVPTSAGPGLELYPAGTALDPVTIGYSGPGGLPKSERWDLPGGPGLEPAARWVSEQPADSATGSGQQLYVSPAASIVHVLELTGADTVDPVLTVTARDAQSLEQVGEEAELAGGGTSLTADKVTTTYDPATETIFHVVAAGETVTVRGARWNPGTEEYELGEIGELSRKAGSLTWNPVEEELAVINHITAAEGATAYVKDEMRIFRRSGGGWVQAVETPLPMPTSGLIENPTSPYGCYGIVAEHPCLGVLPDGSYVQAPVAARLGFHEGVNVAWPAVRIEISESGEVETETIEGTAAEVPDIGFRGVTPGADGSTLLFNTRWGRTGWARVDVVAGEPVLVEAPYDVGEYGNEDDYASFGRAAASDPVRGWEWFTAQGDPRGFVLSAMRDRTFVSRFKYPELLAAEFNYSAIGVGPDGSVYLPIEDKDSGNFGYQLMEYVGKRADFDSQPADAVATLEAGEESEPVAFTSAVSGGEPAPTRQWQVEPAGESGFTDIDGEIGETLSLDATRAMNGSHYRAVYSSEAGEIVSAEATLKIDYAPELVTEPESQTVTEGNDAVFLVAGEANPEAGVTWQRQVSGSWEEIESGEDFEVNGPSLTVLDPEPDQSGLQLRAELTNAVGTTHSRPVTLTVEPRAEIPPEGVDLDHASLEWTGNEEMQKLPPFGGSNYFSAGVSGGTEATYSAASGNARVFQVGAGGETLASWATRAAHVGAGGGAQLVRLYEGEGRVEPDGSATLSWEGSFSVNFYGGLVPFTFVDPELEVDSEGAGTLSAEMVGCSSSQENPDVCEPLPPHSDVTVATFSGVEIDPGGEVGFAPDYAGVEVEVPAGTTPQNRSVEGWGAWPQPLVDFQIETGLASYWYSSGGSFDPHKVPSEFVVDFEGETPPAPPGPEPAPPTPPASAPEAMLAPPPPPAASAGAVAIRGFRATRGLNGNRVVRVASLSCPGGSGSCQVRTPRRVRFKLAGKTRWARILAPKRVKAGGVGRVRARLSKGAMRELGNRAVRLKVRIVLRSGERTARRVARVKVSKLLKTRTVGAKGLVTLGRVRCTAGQACAVKAPRWVRHRVAGKVVAAKVLAPRRLGSRKGARIRLKFRAGARKRLAGREAIFGVRVKLRAGKSSSVRVLRARVKRRAGGAGGGGAGGGSGGGAAGGAPESAPISAEPPRLARPATAVDVGGVTIAWYPRDSWIRYVSSGVGSGDGIHASGGASAVDSTASACPDRPDGGDAVLPYEFRFAPAASWFDPVSGTAGVYGTGSVHFRWKAHTIDLRASNPEIEINGAASRAIFRFSGGEGTAYPDQRASLAGLDLSGQPTVSNGGKTLTYSLMQGTLSEDGINVFAGFYTPPGHEFGCVSVAFTMP